MRNKKAAFIAAAALVLALFAGGALTAGATSAQSATCPGNPQNCQVASCDQGPCGQGQQLRDGSGGGKDRGGFGQCGGGGCGAGQLAQ